MSCNCQFCRRQQPISAIQANCGDIIWETSTVSAISNCWLWKMYVPCGATQDLGKPAKTNEFILTSSLTTPNGIGLLSLNQAFFAVPTDMLASQACSLEWASSKAEAGSHVVLRRNSCDGRLVEAYHQSQWHSHRHVFHCQSGRRLAVIRPADLPPHRTYRSVYGASRLYTCAARYSFLLACAGGIRFSHPG